MKIAQVAPLYEAVPPRLYGGTERVVAHLTDALVELGHDVTLFASGDAQTKARLVPVRDQAIRLDPALLKMQASCVVYSTDWPLLKDGFSTGGRANDCGKVPVFQLKTGV